MSERPFVVGLTGNIATGKSTVLAYMAQLGAHIIDADKVSHAVMAPGGSAYQPVVETFGADIVRPDRTIDRAALGARVFADVAALRQLEQIVHPAVLAAVQQEVAATSADIVILEAIKLLEAGSLITLCDEVWVVTADPEVQYRRLQETRGMDRQEAERRMNAQSPQAEKVRQAQRVIKNDGDLEVLHQQLDRLWQTLVGTQTSEV